ncbi:MAG: hypothetical protein RBT70_09885 [Alphaproteobacteria bacterium]|jgi:hypothetical protein|nr:hypothetical protein [Alphaproteobacteria bacterium]
MKDDRSFEEFVEIVSLLSPKARREVLDIATFHTWRQTRKPAPWLRVLRGAILYLVFEIEKLIEHRKDKP